MVYASLPQPSRHLPLPVLAPSIRAEVRKDKKKREGRLTLSSECRMPDCNLTMFPWRDTSSVKHTLKKQTAEYVNVSL